MRFTSFIVDEFLTKWKEIRLLVLKRDERQCKLCGKKNSAQVHHIVPKSKGGKNEFTNLIMLCGRCHMLLSPVPDWLLTKVWRIPPDKVKFERVKIEKAMEKAKARYFS